MANLGHAVNQCNAYSELPRRSYVLDSCWRMESKTRQFPFVVATDLNTAHNDSAQQSVANRRSLVDDDSTVDESIRANREFLIFHDVDHYLSLKHCFPHCHEIIRCPSASGHKSIKSDSSNPQEIESKTYRDDLAKGRLIFDFDLTKPLPEMQSTIDLQTVSHPNKPIDPLNFVPPHFKQTMEALIIHVFRTYYVNVDVNRFVFGWQVTRHHDKFSMHLIVKNAYFAEFWVKQMRVFYSLMQRVAEQHNCSGLMKAVDFQIPRRNATFRFIGCSKVNGKPLELDSINLPNPTIYDCLVGIYHAEHLKQEQLINLENLNYAVLQQQLDQVEQPLSGAGNSHLSATTLESDRKFKQEIKKQLDFAEEKPAVDLDDASIEKAVELFENFNEGAFVIRDQVGNIINLNRRKPCACPLSGVVHEHENAYLKLYPDGRVGFLCRRGCRHPQTNAWSHTLGYYRTAKRVRVVSPQNTHKIVDQSVVMPTAMSGSVMEKPSGREITMRVNLDKFKDIMTATTKVVSQSKSQLKAEQKPAKASHKRVEKPTNSARSIIMLNNPVVNIQAF